MLRHSRRILCRVSTLNYKTRIEPKTQQAIAGLDASVFGFLRAECCGPTPEKLPGSFQITDHVVLTTAVPPTEWAKRTQNVPVYKALETRLQEELPAANLVVCHAPQFAPNTVFRFNLDDAGRGRCMQYTVEEEVKKLPWTATAAGEVDCTAHYFILICSHRSRDARCGYCGPVLMDVTSQEVRRAFPDERTVHVLPCSHFGGHVYAGNVLVYSKHGGVCFGCFTPNDVQALIDFIRSDDGVVPAVLADRVRGRMTRATAGAPLPPGK